MVLPAPGPTPPGQAMERAGRVVETDVGVQPVALTSNWRATPVFLTLGA
jgi:uncharacterized protein YegL